MSDQLELLRSFATDRILSLTRCRLLEGLKFFRRGSLLPEYNRADVKAALLLVRIANPSEYLTGPEEELLTGRQYVKSSPMPVKTSQLTAETSQQQSRKKQG